MDTRYDTVYNTWISPAFIFVGYPFMIISFALNASPNLKEIETWWLNDKSSSSKPIFSEVYPIYLFSSRPPRGRVTGQWFDATWMYSHVDDKNIGYLDHKIANFWL